MDQQPGMVSTHLISLDELPLAKASVRQDFLRRSRNWREQFQEISDRASDRLEGWLEEPPWEDNENRYSHVKNTVDIDRLDNWNYENDLSDQVSESSSDLRYKKRGIRKIEDQDEDDPWV